MAEVPCLLFIEGQEPKEIIWDIQGELSQIGQFVGLSHYEVQYLPSDPLASPVIISSNDQLQNLLREHGVESHLILLVKNAEKQEEVAPAPVHLEESLPVPEEKPSKPSLPPFFQKIAEALQASPNSSNNVAELKGLVDQYSPLLPPFLKDLSSQFFAAVEQSANSTGSSSSSSSSSAPAPAPVPVPVPVPVPAPVVEEKPAVEQPKEEVKNGESEDSTVEIELEIPPFLSAFAAPFFMPMRRGNCPFFASRFVPSSDAGCHSRSGEAPAGACSVQTSPAEVPVSPSAAPRVPYQYVHCAKCDNCQKRIVGIRYKCNVCHDYDLCEQCEKLNVEQGGTQVHPLEHPMLKMFRPNEASLQYITRALDAINAGKAFYG